MIDADILLVEDNPTDAELTMRALKKNNLANKLHWVKDGEEALDYIFARGKYADRDPGTYRAHPPGPRMPKVDGLEVLQKSRGMRQQAGYP